MKAENQCIKANFQQLQKTLSLKSFTQFEETQHILGLVEKQVANISEIQSSVKEKLKVIYIFCDENEARFMTSTVRFRPTDFSRPHLCQVSAWLIENNTVVSL